MSWNNTQGGDDASDETRAAASRRRFLGGTAALGLLGLTSMNAASASEAGDDTEGSGPPFAPDEHDHSGENGARDRLGVTAPVKSIRADRLSARGRPRVDVDAFGAEGDGETDDTAAIQRAADSPEAGDGAVLSFSGGKTYRVSDTIEVDAAKIRGIEGGNASLVTETDITVLRYAGRFSSTAGPPVGDNPALIDDEFAPYIRALQVYHGGQYDFEDAPYEGVGIEIESTFGLTVSGCHVYRMGTGIRVRGRNRNMILRGNHVFDTLPWGIHFQDVNLHQVNVLGNHLSYSLAPVYVENSEIANLQFVGNDVEVSDGDARCVVVDGGRFTECQFDGNTIQGHGCHRILDFSPDRMRYLIVSNNQLSNCRGDVVYINPGDGPYTHTTVTDNVIKQAGGHAVHVTGDRVPYLQVSDNNVDAGRCAKVEAAADAGPIQVSGNTIAPDERSGDVISVSAGGELSNVSVTDNAASLNYDGLDVETWFVNLDTAGDAEVVTVTGNRFQGRGSGNRGIRLAASEAAGVVAKNNVVAGLAEPATAYELPATEPETVVARDNLDVRRQPSKSFSSPYSFLSLPVVEASAETQAYPESGTLQFEATEPGEHISFAFEVNETDTYRIDFSLFEVWTYGKYEIRIDGETATTYDFYSDDAGGPGFTTLTTRELSAGSHTIAFRNDGKNDASSGYKMGIRKLRLVTAEEARKRE